MMPGDEPLSIPQILFSFRGRIPRKTWWLWGVFGLLGCSLYAYALFSIAGADRLHAEKLADLLLLWPALAVSVKRWHDRDKSGWWALVFLVPLVGWLWVLVENGFLRGTVGANRYGEDITGQV